MEKIKDKIFNAIFDFPVGKGCLWDALLIALVIILAVAVLYGILAKN